ncbi:MAG: FAD-dependent oxidoreductase [Kiritimatiellae bacterium]|nr:FAD-dependent oxidoreductase [Kiritimatiellia bacterium]
MRILCGTILAAMAVAAQGAQIATEATEPTVSRKTYETEVCVVGGGMAGICASVAAARNGAKVVLVQDRPMLGGNASSEIRVPVSGAYGDVLSNGKVLENREGGIIEEIRLENIYRNPSCNWQVWDHVLWNFCAREPNLTVLLNTSVMECATNANRIVSVTGWDSISYTRVTVKADVFIDCSGDGILRLSGAAWMKGRESRRDFGESYAPEEGNLTVMGTTLMVFSEPSGVAADLSAPPETAKPYASPQHAFDGTKDISWTCGTLEWGGETNTIEAASHIRDELFKWSYGLWENEKSVLKDGRDAEGRIWERTFVSSLPGKRESIRFIGDHILTQNDLLAEGRAFADNIGHGGWPMDDHFSAGMHAQKQTTFNKCPKVYGIPYRSLYSKNIDNLMFAGRDISATHMALSSTRVQGTTSVLGQAAGTAAAIAVRHGTTPRGVYKNHLAELQDTLQWQDQFIPWRDRKITALSKKGRISHEVLRDGMDRIRLDGGHGAWLKPGGTTEYAFDGPKTFEGVRLVVDTNMNDNRWLVWWIGPKKARRLPDEMPRDFNVQVRSGGEWKTVKVVRDNYRRWMDIRFDMPIAGDACRVVWTRPWGETTEQRVFSFEVY